ncbi:MAG: DUF6588 family protein [Candidatus Zhuqueibacterota bacterium]
MKTKYGIALVIMMLFSGLSSVSYAQDLDLAAIITPANSQASDALSQAEANLDEIVDPLLDLFGFYTGGGVYHSANVHGIGGFDVGVRVVSMMVSDDQKPTLPNGQSEFNGGVFRDVAAVPLPVLQLSLGLPGNLEATGRFMTYSIGEDEKKGNVTLVGVGLKYGVLQNMLLPKVALAATYHYLTVPDEFDFNTVNSFNTSLIVSKGFLLIDFYGGLGYDWNKFTAEVDLGSIGTINKDYSKGNWRGNVGVKVKPFPLIYIHADYDFGPVKGFSAGLGVNFL